MVMMTDDDNRSDGDDHDDHDDSMILRYLEIS